MFPPEDVMPCYLWGVAPPQKGKQWRGDDLWILKQSQEKETMFSGLNQKRRQNSVLPPSCFIIFQNNFVCVGFSDFLAKEEGTSVPRSSDVDADDLPRTTSGNFLKSSRSSFKTDVARRAAAG